MKGTLPPPIKNNGPFLRKNEKIKGAKISGSELKILQYADDTEYFATTEDSIKQIFNVIGKYERGTGAKMNVEKTEGLWLGSWKQRTDKPFNLDWKNSKVKCLGIWIGNENTTNENFIEQQSKVKNILNFWKKARLSLIGKIKVLNTFILPRLWYRTEFQNIPNNIERNIH